ncbi:hypothetical protein [Marinobacter sp. AL4B]|uniref:hypothetical protein n=1 Tax=Marinobacter sp. AL4B TaxID=2871173 RepID=UPI001CAA5313|nr:hypothetical protein [Marinobacter sp. AL4B]MBZ0333433.1 hypothetical protein [Marinobacter sp. AL4B]
MKARKANQGPISRVAPAMGLILITTLYGCGGGGGSDNKSESTPTSARSESVSELISEPTATDIKTTTAVASRQAPADFSFSNYQQLLVSVPDVDLALLTPGRQYVLKVSEPAGEVFLLTSVTYSQLFETSVSVPLALSTLVVDVFDVLASELVITREIAL